ncbi:hypothetical protein JTB14_035927 [Gonioctena quinquepunctata]|nr:hypothetical protein JTB14_035927 [Gonioctena quinquepunctata]
MSPKYLRSCVLMRKFADNCGAQNPDRLCGTKLRKHIATTCITLNLSESELANFMGHRENIDKSFYRQPLVNREILKMSKLLEVAQGANTEKSDKEEETHPEPSPPPDMQEKQKRDQMSKLLEVAQGANTEKSDKEEETHPEPSPPPDMQEKQKRDQLCILLRGVKGGLEVLEGKLQALKPLVENARYDKKLVDFNQADSCALLILTVNMTRETLPAEYLSFKSSWNLMSDTDKNIDNLTSQLCAYEKAVTMKCKSNLTCNYCKLNGHKVRDCVKWKTYGRPPKPEKQKKDNKVKTKNVTLLAVSSAVLFSGSDKDNWYVDNGATNHITNQSELFENFEPFDQDHQVITANGDSIAPLGRV